MDRRRAGIQGRPSWRAWAVAGAATVLATVACGCGKAPDASPPSAAPTTVAATEAATDPAPAPAPAAEAADRAAAAPAPTPAAAPGGAPAVDAADFEAVETLRGKFAASKDREELLDALDRAELILELASAELEESEPDLSEIREQIGESGLAGYFTRLSSDPAVAEDEDAREAASSLAATLISLAKGG